MNTDRKNLIIISASLIGFGLLLFIIGVSLDKKSVSLIITGLLLLSLGGLTTFAAIKSGQPSDGGNSSDGDQPSSSDPNILHPDQTYKCSIKGMTIASPWFMKTPGDTKCYRPSFGMTKCCNLNTEGNCVANFDPSYKDQKTIVDWADACGIDYTIDTPDGTVDASQPLPPPPPQPIKPSPPPSQLYQCPPGYTGKSTLGCTAQWSTSCDQACANKNCTDYGGRFLPLDYGSNPYTCAPKCPEPFTGYINNGQCSSENVIMPDFYQTACTNNKGMFSQSVKSLNPPSVEVTCSW